MIALAFGIFGLIIGSFLNVVIIRRGSLSLGGRSQCMSCGEMIAWYDNIPLLSWLYLRGRCRSCGSAISLQYPLVEGATALLFAFIGASFFPSLTVSSLFLQLAPALVIAALLIAIAVYDLRHTIIPDPWVYAFALSALVFGWGFWGAHAEIPLYLVGGPLAAAPLFALWFVSGGRWMGFGDVKLALGIGWLLGPLYGFVGIVFAFIVGACISVPLLLLSSRRVARGLHYIIPLSAWRGWEERFTMKSEIPFGPFLIVSCITIWLALISHIDPLQLVGLLPLH